MAAVIKSMMSREPVTWLLYGVGVAVALVAELSAIPPLPLALGMYLPLHLTTPLLVGGFLSHLVKHSTRDKELAERRHNRGTLIPQVLLPAEPDGHRSGCPQAGKT